MQRNIRAAPGFRGRRQVIGIGLAFYLEDSHGDGIRHFLARGKPLSGDPAVNDLLGPVIRLRLVDYIVVGIEDKQRVRQRLGGNRCQILILEQLNEWCDVITTQHGAEQFSGTRLVDQRTVRLTLGNRGKETRFHISGLVDTRWYAVGQQFNQQFFLTGGWIL